MGSLSYLLDTNIISEPTKQRPNQAVILKLKAHSGKMALSSITWHELLTGLHTMPVSKRRAELEYFFHDVVKVEFPILPFDIKAAEWFASQRGRLIQQGKKPSYADGQIASIAATNDLILVTRNTKDISNYEGLSFEDWFEADAPST